MIPPCSAQEQSAYIFNLISVFSSQGHLPSPLPGFSAKTSDDIRSIARLLEDVDKIVFRVLTTSRDAHSSIPIDDKMLSMMSAGVYEHKDDELWAYLGDNSSQEYWKIAFDSLLLSLTHDSGRLAFSWLVLGQIKTFEFALSLPTMLETVKRNCQLPPVVSYRITMKAEMIHSFLRAAEATVKVQYLSSDVSHRAS